MSVGISLRGFGVASSEMAVMFLGLCVYDCLNDSTLGEMHGRVL
jgi:hypothetical protein